MFRDRQQINLRFGMKLVGALVLFLAGWLFRVQEAGEGYDDLYFQDFTQEYSEVHGAAPATTFNLPIDYDQTVSDQGQVEYGSAIEEVVDFLNEKNKIGPSFASTIRKITVSNNEGARRGFAGWYDIVFNMAGITSPQELVQLIAHEMGHVFDLGFMQGSLPPKHSLFTEFEKPVFFTNDPSILYYQISWKSEKTRSEDAKKKDFCSGYGMTDPFEDFSECFNLYLYHNTLFKQIAKKNDLLKRKYNFIATLFQGKYIQGLAQDLAYIKTTPNRRPRDTTKIK